MQTEKNNRNGQLEGQMAEELNRPFNHFLPGFHQPGKLYGREKEKEALIAAFERASGGAREMLLVSGYSGIGKSALIFEVYKPELTGQSFFISGKFDRFRGTIPYSAFIRAFEQLIHILLTKSANEIKWWKERILERIGKNGRILTEVIPALEELIGRQPGLPETGPAQKQNRFKLFFLRFVSLFAEKAHPLIIFLDDLQWIDFASLHLIKTLMTNSDTKYMLFIGAYRDSDYTAINPLLLTLFTVEKEGVPVRTLKLKSISAVHVNQLLSESLECPLEKCWELTELVYAKTNGNPFFVYEFLKTLYQQKLLKFDMSERWVWNLPKIKALNVTSNVAELLAAEIEQLEPVRREVLNSASCLGNGFSLTIFLLVYESSKEHLPGVLSSLIKDGFLILQDDLYYFSHDRILDAVYSLLGEDEKRQSHLHIGRSLLTKSSEEELAKTIFTTVDQLNAGKEGIMMKEELVRLASLNLQAGIKAKNSTAYRQGLNYLQTGISFIKDSWWNEQYELAVQLYTEGAEAAYLSSDCQLMETFFKIVLKNSKDVLDRARVYEIRINAHASQGNHLEAIYTGCSILKELGVKVSKNPGLLHIISGLFKTKMRLRGKSTADLKKLPPMTDLYKREAMRILMSIGSSGFHVLPNMMPIIAFTMLKLSLSYGNSPYSAYGFAVYGHVICGVLNDKEEGVKYGELALQIVRNFNCNKLLTKIVLINNTAIKPWKYHLKDTVSPLLEAFKTGLEAGDLEYACLSIHNYILNLLLSGKNLDELYKKNVAYLHNAEQLQQANSISALRGMLQFITNMIGENRENRGRLEGDMFDEAEALKEYVKNDNFPLICGVYIFDLMLCYLFDDYIEAVDKAIMAGKYLKNLMGTVFVPVYTFYHSLSLFALSGKQNKKVTGGQLKQINKNQKQMQLWARYAPENYLHKYYLVEAEKAAGFGLNEKAACYYEKAIKGAGENEYIHEQALAYECAAKFYLKHNELEKAAKYMEQSKECYTRWGAFEKVKHLEETFF